MKTAIATLLILSGTHVLAAGTGPRSKTQATYLFEGKTLNKAQAILTGIRNPEARILECHETFVDQDTARLKRVKVTQESK